ESRIPNSLAESWIKATLRGACVWPTLSAHEGPPARSASPGRHDREAVRPGGVRAVIAENLLIKQQLIVLLRSYWVLVVMDQFTRCLVGVGVQRGPVNGADLFR